ncbi:unnamed protein product [Malus baccata var. baccata]
MAFSLPSSPCTSLPHLQSSSALVPVFRLLQHPLLLSPSFSSSPSSSFSAKRFESRLTRIRITASAAAATIESGNGALLSPEKSFDSISYGRHFLSFSCCCWPEGEGISFRHPRKPLLIATYNPEEGAVREHLLDRIAINLSADFEMGFDDRVAAVAIATQFQEHSSEVFKMVEEETEYVKTQIILAREYLKDVTISREQVKYLVLEALRGGCQGHRAEFYAARVAKSLAALDGREKVDVDDLKKAVELVILPCSIINENPPEQKNQQPPPPPPPPQNEQSGEEQNAEEEKEQGQIPEEFIFDAEGGLVDEKLLFFAQQAQKRKGKAGRAKNVIFSEDRGRYIKPMLPKGPIRRLAVDATLRAAAPYQKLRREKNTQSSRKVFVERSDMRAKRMAQKAGALVIFVVDASGSMALNRMQNAKGEALKLLAESYTSRDQESVFSVWNHQEFKVNLECCCWHISCSLDLTAHGIIMVAHVTPQLFSFALTCGISYWCFSMKDEILEVAGKIYKAGMCLLVIDTENKFVSTGFAKETARVAQGKYYYLPDSSDAVISAGRFIGTEKHMKH